MKHSDAWHLFAKRLKLMSEREPVGSGKAIVLLEISIAAIDVAQEILDTSINFNESEKA